MSFFWNLSLHPASAPALILSDQTQISYGALDQAAQIWAEKIKAATRDASCLLALEFETSVDSIAAYLGALQSGMPVVLVEPGHAGPETPLQKVYTPEILIRRETADAPLALHRNTVVTDPSISTPHPDLSILLSTSGSTGDPKLVRLSAQNIHSNADSIAQYLDVTSQDRAMLTLPLFYSYGLSVLNSYLARGAALVLNDDSVLEPKFWEVFQAAKATSLALVPHQFDLLEGSGFLKNAPAQAPSLRYITQAGGRLEPETARRFAAAGKTQGWDLVLMYGQTEAAPRISWVPPKSLPAAADTIGQAVPGGKLWIADEDGTEITASNIAGELVYEGPNVMMGYGQCREDLSRAAETPSLKTGDIAERTTDGFFRIVGRMKRFVKIFGLRLSLDQIEALLARHGHPTEAVAVYDKLVLLHREADQGETVRQIVSDEYDLPLSVLHIAPLAELPLLASGKTDRPALQRLAAEALAQDEANALPSSDVSISEVLAHATRSRTVGPNDSFNSLGGDSLSYLQVQMALEEHLGHAPQRWEDMKLSELEALTPKKDGAKWTQLNMDVLLRLAAICLIVAQHASNYPLYGGTWILIALMGYSAARFQFPSIKKGQAKAIAWQMLYPIIPLYFLIMVTYNLGRDDVPWKFYLLMGDYHIWVDSSSFLIVYWFVGLYFKLVLMLLAFAAVPYLRNSLARAPFILPFGLSLACLIAVTNIELTGLSDGRHIMWPIPHVGSHGFLECLPLFFAGWMIHVRDKIWQIPVIFAITIWNSALLMQLEVAFYTVVLLNIAVALLMSGLHINLPRSVNRVLQKAAGLTLFVYLLHHAVTYVARYTSLALPNFEAVIFSVPISFLVAYLGKRAFDYFDEWIRQPRVQKTKTSQP